MILSGRVYNHIGKRAMPGCCIGSWCMFFRFAFGMKIHKKYKITKNRKNLKKLLTVSVEDGILIKRSREQTSLKISQKEKIKNFLTDRKNL